MTSARTLNRAVLTTIVVAAAALSLLQAAQAGPPGPVVPVPIDVPEGNKVFLVGHAVGVQIYSCNATTNGFAWAFVAPRADVLDDNGKLLTTHYGGPTWEARDGSKVVGRVVERSNVDGAIPWLKLEAASTSAGPDGNRLEGTTFIQRVATTGGLAPAAAECNGTTAGDRAEVPYTADYFFWKASA